MLGVLISPWLRFVLTIMKFIATNHHKTSGRGYMSSKSLNLLPYKLQQCMFELFAA
ncbi:unnamed protein product [Brassica oleracea var. botrytis]